MERKPKLPQFFIQVNIAGLCACVFSLYGQIHFDHAEKELCRIGYTFHAIIYKADCCTRLLKCLNSLLQCGHLYFFVLNHVLYAFLFPRDFTAPQVIDTFIEQLLDLHYPRGTVLEWSTSSGSTALFFKYCNHSGCMCHKIISFTQAKVCNKQFSKELAVELMLCISIYCFPVLFHWQHQDDNVK